MKVKDLLEQCRCSIPAGIEQIHDYNDVDVWEKALIQFADKNFLMFNWMSE